MILRLLTLFVIVSQAIIVLGQGSVKESIVRIYAGTGVNRKCGTGTFVNVNGKDLILTCYHVVVKSDSIEVYSDAFPRKIYNVRVVAYDNIKDIALLEYSKRENFLPKNVLINALPDKLYTIKGYTIGHPRNTPEQRFDVSFTDEQGTISTLLFFDKNGKRIFKEESNFKILPVYVAMYEGMSGAPVIVNNSVIAILAGSIGEGGAFTWAIPASYCFDMQINKSGYRNTLSLPELDCLKPGNSSICKTLVANESVDMLYGPLNDVSDRIQRNCNYLLEVSSSINMEIDSALKCIRCYLNGDTCSNLDAFLFKAYYEKTYKKPYSLVKADQTMYNLGYKGEDIINRCNTLERDVLLYDTISLIIAEYAPSDIDNYVFTTEEINAMTTETQAVKFLANVWPTKINAYMNEFDKTLQACMVFKPKKKDKVQHNREYYTCIVNYLEIAHDFFKEESNWVNIASKYISHHNYYVNKVYEHIKYQSID